MTDPTTSRFASGAGTAVLGAGGAALVDAPPDDSVVVFLEDHLLRRGDFGTLISSLLQIGLQDLPGFALVTSVEGGYRVLVRGLFTADIVSDGVASPLSAGDVSVWREEAFGALTSVVLSSGSAPGRFPFKVVAGTVPACALEWLPQSVGGSPGSASPSDAEISIGPILAVIDSGLADEELGPLETDGDSIGADGGATFIPVDSAMGGVVSAFDEAEHTVFRSPEPEPDVSNDGHTIVRVKLVDEGATKQVNTLIDEVPSSVRTFVALAVDGALSSGAEPTLDESADEDPDHDGRTEIRRPQSALAFVPAGAPNSSELGPTVHAVSCPVGHPNPVTQGRCRQCDSEIVERMAMTIPRPPLGLLRFSTNQVVDVDGPIVIGRMPPTGPIDGSQPNVVAIDNTELSRFHALVTVDDWFVYVADQGSTNGLSVTAPGREPVTCRAHEPMQLQPGSVVNLGGVATFRFDVT